LRGYFFLQVLSAAVTGIGLTGHLKNDTCQAFSLLPIVKVSGDIFNR
jgi:hypothetical protein